MNVGGGEAADQMVRMMLSGTEVAVRLSGSALKNMLALTMALAQNRKTISGKVNMGKMLRETRDLRRFPLTPQQYKQFKKLAQKHKLLYSVIRDRDGRGKLMDVILPVTELDRANAIFERILYTTPPEPELKPAREVQRGHEVFRQERQSPERQAPEQAQVKKTPAREKAVSRPQEARQRQVKPQRVQREASQQSAERGRQEAPVTRRSADTPKKDSRSERDLNVIKASSSTCRGNGNTRTTNERPSVEAQLKAYRVQLNKTSAPAKVKVKARPIQR